MAYELLSDVHEKLGGLLVLNNHPKNPVCERLYKGSGGLCCIAATSAVKINVQLSPDRPARYPEA